MGKLANRIRRPRLRGLQQAGVLLLFALAGCASFRPVDPSSDRIELAENEGILILHIKTDVPLHSVEISGGTAAESLGAGEHLLALATKAGSLRWYHLERKIDPWTYRYFFSLIDDYFGFTVEPGVINYPGQLIIQRPDHSHANDLFIRLRIVNQSATMFEYLAHRHPSLLEQFPMRYSGWGRDEFLERYLEARRSISEARSPGASDP